MSEKSENIPTPIFYAFGTIIPFILGYGHVMKSYFQYDKRDGSFGLYEYVSGAAILIALIGPFVTSYAMYRKRDKTIESAFYAACGLAVWIILVPDNLGIFGGIIAAAILSIFAALIIRFTVMARGNALDTVTPYVIMLTVALSATFGASVAYGNWTHTLPSRVSAWLDVPVSKESNFGYMPIPGKPYCIIMGKEITHKSDLYRLATSQTYIVHDNEHVYQHATMSNSMSSEPRVGRILIGTLTIDKLMAENKISGGCNPKLDFVRKLPD
jgi:hypothetical protein